LEVRVLTDGSIALDKSLLVFGKYFGTKYDAVLNSLFIRSGNDRILVDTGGGELGQAFIQVTRPNGRNLINELQAIGVSPTDITMVINTHLHWDHSGYNSAFKNAKFFVNKEELRYAYSPDKFMKNMYARSTFDFGLEFEPVSGEYKVVEGVTIIPTPGHTVGHQSVLIETEKSKFIFCGDCAPLKENIERRNIPGITTNAIQALESIDRLRSIKGAVFIPGHEESSLGTL